MRHQRVRVKRDGNTVHNNSVVPWEIPILELLFEEGNVEALEEFIDVPEKDYPDPREEFMRLQKAYGADTHTSEPHVVTVYGQGRNGLRQLTKAIDAAREEEEETAPKLKPKVMMTSSRRRPHAADPLLA